MGSEVTDRKLLQRYALVVAANAKIAQMSAENETRRMKGLAPAFDAICFEPVISQLEAVLDDLGAVFE